MEVYRYGQNRLVNAGDSRGDLSLHENEDVDKQGR